jgi:hypothetical protein
VVTAIGEAQIWIWAVPVQRSGGAAPSQASRVRLKIERNLESRIDRFVYRSLEYVIY